MFLNPIMLAGLAGAALPLVLHLLSRARYRNVPWGAMMFLDSAQPQQEQNTRLRQSVLLGIRMLMVGVLAAAMARPVLQGAWARAMAHGPVTVGIVIDCSASMSLREQDRSRLEEAREAAIEVLSQLRGGDEAFLLPLGLELDALPVPTADLQSVASRVVDLQAGPARADLADGLLRAAEALSRHGREMSQLYLITDRQAVNWSGVDEDFSRRWEELGQGGLRGGGAGPALRVIVVGSEERENVAVESVGLVSPPGVAGQSAGVQIQLRNYGGRARAQAPLALLVDDVEVYRTKVDLPAGQSAAVVAPLAFDHPGDRRLSAVVEVPGVAADNRLDRVVSVIDPIRVLIVSGDERSGWFRSESDFLRLALSPFQAVGRGGDTAVVEVMAAEQWDQPDLAGYQVLVLANVPQLSAGQVRSIEHFVHGGGGLLVAPGNLSRVETYNRVLYRGGEGILPAALEPATPGDGSRATAVLGLELDHPVFHFVRDRPDPVPPATIGRYFPLSRLRSDARVLSRYVTGDPFLVELSAGKGRVLLMTTPVDADWGTLPMTGFYLPFVQSMTRYLALGGVPQRNVPLGRPLHLLISAEEPERVLEDEAVVVLPSGQRRTVGLIQLPDRTELQFHDTREVGFYAVRLGAADGAERTKWFSVQRPAAESDLTPLDDARWRELQEGFGFELIDARRQELSAALALPGQRWELWWLLMAAVVALAIAEMVATRLWVER